MIKEEGFISHLIPDPPAATREKDCAIPNRKAIETQRPTGGCRRYASASRTQQTWGKLRIFNLHRCQHCWDNDASRVFVDLRETVRAPAWLPERV